MDKIKIGIIAILVIFLVGGCYAVYNGNNVSNAVTDISSSPNAPDTPSNDTNNQPNGLQNDNPGIAKDIPRNNNINNYASAPEITYRQIPGADVFVNTDIDYTDMYLQCVACGGFMPLGEVTKALPEDALCPDLCGGNSINVNKEYAVTYEFAKAFYDKYGRHPEEIQDTDVASSDDAKNPATNWNDLNLPEGVKIAVYDMNNPDIYEEYNVGPGIYVPEDAKLIYEDDGVQIYDNGMEVNKNSNSGVVYDTIEPVPNSVDSLVLTPVDMPTDSGSVSDTNNPVSIE